MSKKKQKRGRRTGPSASSMRGEVDHTVEHRGDTGKYGTYYTGDAPTWKCSADEHELALLPFKVENPEDSPFRKNNSLNKPFNDEDIEADNCYAWKLTLLVHGNIGPNKDRVVCPGTIKEPCPFCEYIDTLDSEEDEDTIRKYRPSKRGLVALYCFDSRKERKKGVQIWEAPHKAVIDVIASSASRDKKKGGYKDFFIPEENWNILFERTGSGFNTEYLDVRIEKRSEEDRFSTKKLDSLLEDVPDLEQVVEVKSYEELAEMLNMDDEEKTKDKKKKKKKKGKKDSGKKKRRRYEEEDEEEEDEEEEDEEEEDEEEELDEEELDEEEELDDDEDDEDEEDEEEELPECFGLKCNKISKCKKCPEDTWEECFEKTESRKKKKKGKKR